MLSCWWRRAHTKWDESFSSGPPGPASWPQIEARAWLPIWLIMTPRHLCTLSSVIQSCPTLCNPVDCSMPGFPVLHHLPELAQTHVHWVSDAIWPSHPRSCPSPPALNLSWNWRECCEIRRNGDHSMAAEASWSSCFSYCTIGVHFFPALVPLEIIVPLLNPKSNYLDSHRLC